MTPARTPSLFGRSLRPDLAAFFAVRSCVASHCERAPEQPLVGVLAELNRDGRLR